MLKLFITLLTLAAAVPDSPSDSLLLITWNLENFFDPKCDSISVSEMEFSAQGARRWSYRRFSAKCSGMAKTILAAADRFGRLPDLVAVQEVENRRALRKLLEETSLRKTDYRIVHYDSPDPRGIDCALLFRAGTLNLRYSAACHLYDSLGHILRTRDILLAELSDRRGNRVAVLVNHHPSKIGSNSAGRREIASRRLRNLCDSLEAAGCSRIVAVGDFNRPMDWVDPDCRGGTLKYDGRWERIDGCVLARGCTVKETVLAFPFLLTRDSAHGGLKPLRTYNGPRYLGGLSDHLPVAVCF